MSYQVVLYHSKGKRDFGSVTFQTKKEAEEFMEELHGKRGREFRLKKVS